MQTQLTTNELKQQSGSGISTPTLIPLTQIIKCGEARNTPRIFLHPGESVVDLIDHGTFYEGYEGI
jgi:hypothetical protein